MRKSRWNLQQQYIKEKKKDGLKFFYDAPIPTTESYFNIMATPLSSPLCSGRPAPKP